MPRTITRRDLFAPQPATAAPVVTAEVHFLSRATFGPTPQALAELQALGIETWLEQQLEPGSVDDTALETLLPNIVSTTASTGADIRLLARAIYSKRQLAWRMVHFLNNHFSTNRSETQSVSEVQEDEAFYKNCFGTFEKVLKESATSPAMIDYLDSQVNIASAPNENYARELMELHTLGVGGGYTENDIAQIAKVFTGWSRAYTTVGTTVVSGMFRFRPQVHSQGPKTTSLGWSTPGYSGVNGGSEGMQFLAFLASHPNTAVRFVTKLCQYFVADAPPAGLLQRAMGVFRATGGSLKETLRTILLDPEFGTTAIAKTKVHDGFEFVANAVRRIGFASLNWSAMNTRVSLLRCLPHHNPVPTGYPEIGAEWQGAGNVLSRWDFMDDLVHDRINGAAVPWTTLIGATPPTSGAVWVGTMLSRFVDDEVPASTVVALTAFMNARLAALPANPTWTQARPAARALASLVLRLPEAQLH